MDNYELIGSRIRLGLDMDGVLFDFDSKIMDKFAEMGIQFTDVKEMSSAVEFDKSIKQRHREIYHVPGFFANLPPIKGAVNAYKYLKSLTDINNNKIFEIFIVSTPSFRNQTCCIDKINDLNKYFGPELLEKVFFCRDKTLVNLDILIDDKPEIRGFNGSSECLSDSNSVTNKMSFQHIRFHSDMYKYSDDIPIINNWIDETYIDVVKNVCVNKNLLREVVV